VTLPTARQPNRTKTIADRGFSSLRLDSNRSRLTTSPVSPGTNPPLNYLLTHLDAATDKVALGWLTLRLFCRCCNLRNGSNSGAWRHTVNLPLKTLNR
jgi:hypothetical protein